jgi:c-di-GMP-binding flagellar brake protein YcgR
MENRLYERISLPINLVYEVKTRPKEIREAKSKDISGSGICLSLKEKLLQKTELDINIKIANDNNNNNSIKLKGRVIWSRRVEIVTQGIPMVYYDTGIELVGADPININRIISHFYGKSF